MGMVVLDLLCLESTLKLILLKRKTNIGVVCFLNRTRFLSALYLKALYVFGVSDVKQIDSLEYGLARINSTSLYESIQRQLWDLLNRWVSQDEIRQSIAAFAGPGFDPVKVSGHLKEAAYNYAYKIVEMKYIAEHTCGGSRVIFLVRKHPLNKLAELLYGQGACQYYPSLISNRIFIVNREKYVYDRMLNRFYFANRFDCLAALLTSYVGTAINSSITRWVNLFRKSVVSKNGQASILVELIQSRVRVNEINDLYWFKDSMISSDSVWGLEVEDYDQASATVLDELRINRCKIMHHALRWFARWGNKAHAACRFVHVDGRSILCFLPNVLALVLLIFSWSEKGWLRYQYISFEWFSRFWRSIYHQLGIKMLWSMYDMDQQKFAKAQAIKQEGGLFLGSHWSNFPLCDVLSHKAYDVLLTWGSHFEKNIFTQYPFQAVFHTGYPLDFYFSEKKATANERRRPYSGKYILSYQDNTVSHDLPCSETMQIEIDRMLVSLLEKYEWLIIFLKPKRKREFQQRLGMSGLQPYIDKGRIQVFLGETPRTKAVPAEIGAASDLVVGLSVSTAAAECYFAGTLSFHADLTGFAHNDFARKGSGKVVFSDLSGLQRAIEEMITGGNRLSQKEYDRYYEDLDPFQDGNAARRTGFILREFQKAFESGIEGRAAISQVSEKFEEYLKQDHTLATI